jgi:hypothetical protein
LAWRGVANRHRLCRLRRCGLGFDDIYERDMTRAVIPEPADAMKTIRHLRAELQSVLEREAATHARHDARVEALEAQIAALRAMPAPVSILGEHDGVLPDDVYNILTKTEPAAPVTVQAVLSNPLKDRGKMIKPVPGAPAGGYPLTPNPAESAEATPVTVEEAARVLLAACPNPLFDQLKPVMMGEIVERFTGQDEDGEEISYTRSVSWDAIKQVIRFALRALAGEKPNE